MRKRILFSVLYLILFGPCPHLSITAECYLSKDDPNQHMYQADVNKDGVVNYVDFAIYAKSHTGGYYVKGL